MGLSKLSELVVVNVTTFLLNQNLFITINLEKLGIFSPSTLEGESGGFMRMRPAWSVEQVPGQTGLLELHRESLP